MLRVPKRGWIPPSNGLTASCSPKRCALALWLRRLDVVGAAVAAVGAGGWLLANAANEGTVLFEVQPGNGLTQADLVVVPAALLVLLLALQRLRGR